MCISPNFVWVQRGPTWEQQPVGCRQCWRCRKNRVNDYVARCMAEAAYSESVCVLTLTYAPRDDLADRVLHPRHFQLFMKLLRRAGHKVRYLVVGEYGDLKGRAHFHAILFFQELRPAPEGAAAPFYNEQQRDFPHYSAPFSRQIPQKRMIHIREWPHGHVLADWASDERAMRYVCKYLLKGGKEYWFSLSKKPTLGAVFFARKAETAKRFGVLPSSFQYLPPGGDATKSYLMTGATRRDYLNAITTDPGERGRMSEWVQKSFDKAARKRLQDEIDAIPPDVQLARIAENISDRQIPEDQLSLSLAKQDAWWQFMADEYGETIQTRTETEPD